MYKGLFISIEGGEGCGKTTQINKLKEYFAENFDENQYLFVREPGGTPLSEEIRKLILDYKEDKPLPMTELLLFCASRHQISYEKIIPALEEGKIVIADRFYDSTVAYQGEARGVLPKQDILALTKLVIGSLKPDLTFYLKLSPEVAFERKCDQVLDNIESEGLEFHKAVARGFDYMAKTEPERFCVVDASLSPEQVFETIKEKIEEKL